MSEAVQELEGVAGKYAAEAIRQDGQGVEELQLLTIKELLRR